MSTYISIESALFCLWLKQGVLKHEIFFNWNMNKKIVRQRVFWRFFDFGKLERGIRKKCEYPWTLIIVAKEENAHLNLPSAK